MVALTTLLLALFSATTLIQLFCLVRVLIEHRRTLGILDGLLAEAIKTSLDEIKAGGLGQLEGVEAPHPLVGLIIDQMKQNITARNKQGQFESVMEIEKAR